MNQYNNGQGFQPQYPQQGQPMTPQQQYQQQNPAPQAQAAPKKEPVVVVTQGRIIFTSQDGDLFKGAQKVNMKNGQKMFDPQTNIPIWEWVIGLSIPKAAIQGEPDGIGRIWKETWAEFFRKHPNGQQMIDPRTGFPDPKTFSLKCKDGDLALDQQGKPLSTREGYKGCYVFTLSTRLKPQYFIPQGGLNVEVNEGIKVGDIVNISVQVSSGDSGIYLNPKMIQLVERGAAIISGPSVDAVFGMAQPQRSQYIQSVPDPMTNPATAFGAQMPAQGQQYQQPMQQPAPQAAPNYGALPQQYQQQPATQNYQPQGGGYDPNAGQGGQVQQPAQYVGGNQMQPQATAMNVGVPQYPTNGNGQMPR